MSFLSSLMNVPALALSIVRYSVTSFFGTNRQVKLSLPSVQQAELIARTPPLMVFKYASSNGAMSYDPSRTLADRKIEIYQTSKGPVSVIKALMGYEVKLRQLYSNSMLIRFSDSFVDKSGVSREEFLNLDTVSFKNFSLKKIISLLEHIYRGGKIHAILRSNSYKLIGSKPNIEVGRSKDISELCQGAASSSSTTSYEDILAIVFELPTNVPFTESIEAASPFPPDFGCPLIGSWSSSDWEVLLWFCVTPKASTQDVSDKRLHLHPAFLLIIRRLDGETDSSKHFFEDNLFLENSSSFEVTPLVELHPDYVCSFVKQSNVELLFLSSNKEEWKKVDSIFGCVFSAS